MTPRRGDVWTIVRVAASRLWLALLSLIVAGAGVERRKRLPATWDASVALREER